MVLTVSFVLSPVTGLSCHRHPAQFPAPNLTPASGRQDHTTSPSASGAFVGAPSASIASCPASVTISSRPSVGQDGVNMNLIWVDREEKYFFSQDWTGDHQKTT
jgi:hypothetical protein